MKAIEAESIASAVAGRLTDDPQRFDAALFVSRDLSSDGSRSLSDAIVVRGTGPVRPIDPGPTAVYLFLTGLVGVLGVVHRQQPVRRQDMGASDGTVEAVAATGSILVQLISPDSGFAGLVTEPLRQAGYAVEPVASVSDLLAIERPHAPALVLVDSRTPDWDMLRTDPRMKHVPVLVAVPDGVSYSEADVVADLERGADGVHLCQEGLRLLAARVGAYLRRAGVQTAKRTQCRIGAVELDADLREIKIGGEPVPFSAKPFALLEALMRAPSKVFSRRELASLLWGSGFAIGDHTLDVHIHAIRQKLDRDPLRRCRLVTIKRVGFKLQAVPTAAPAEKTTGLSPARSSSSNRPAALCLMDRRRTPASPLRKSNPWFGEVPRQRGTQSPARTALVRQLRSSV
jgi:DNA-binding response OmpR family regulator